MQENLLRLYPQPGENSAITGLYLAPQVHRLGTTESPLVYANFLSSLAAIQSIMKIQQKGCLPFYDEHTLSSPFWLESAAFRSLSR